MRVSGPSEFDIAEQEKQKVERLLRYLQSDMSAYQTDYMGALRKLNKK